jgi:hypothetical protein
VDFLLTLRAVVFFICPPADNYWKEPDNASVCLRIAKDRRPEHDWQARPTASDGLRSPILPEDTMPEDIEQIEVIRGPGATLWELGQRGRVGRWLAFDVAISYNRYTNRHTHEPGIPFFEDNPPPPHLVLPNVIKSNISGETHGLELSTKFKVMSFWNLSAGTLFEIHLHPARPVWISRRPSKVRAAALARNSRSAPSLTCPISWNSIRPCITLAGFPVHKSPAIRDSTRGWAGDPPSRSKSALRCKICWTRGTLSSDLAT